MNERELREMVREVLQEFTDDKPTVEVEDIEVGIAMHVLEPIFDNDKKKVKEMLKFLRPQTREYALKIQTIIRRNV